jgi:hypothetical protein
LNYQARRLISFNPSQYYSIPIKIIRIIASSE